MLCPRRSRHTPPQPVHGLNRRGTCRRSCAAGRSRLREGSDRGTVAPLTTPSVCASLISPSPSPLHPDAAQPDGARAGSVAREYIAIGVDFERYEARGQRSPIRVTTWGCRPSARRAGTRSCLRAAGRYEIQHALDSVFGPRASRRLTQPESDGPVATSTSPRASTSTSCSRWSWPSGARTCTSRPGAPVGPSGCTASCVPVEGVEPELTRLGHPARWSYAILTQKQREKFEESPRARLRVLGARARPASGSTCTASATRSVRFRLIPFEIKKLEDLGLIPPSVSNFAMLPRGLRPRHRADRFRQVDDAGFADRPGEPRPGATTS